MFYFFNGLLDHSIQIGYTQLKHSNYRSGNFILHGRLWVILECFRG